MPVEFFCLFKNYTLQKERLSTLDNLSFSAERQGFEPWNPERG